VEESFWIQTSKTYDSRELNTITKLEWHFSAKVTLQISIVTSPGHCWPIKRKEEIVYFLYLISVPVNEWFLFNAKWAMFKRWWWCLLCIRLTDTFIGIFIELAHRNNSLLFDRSFNSDRLPWVRINQSLLLLLNTLCLAEKQQIPNFIVFGLIWSWLKTTTQSFSVSTFYEE